jgi:hypothetical protein
MSFVRDIKNLDAKVAVFGLPVAPVVSTTTTVPSKVPAIGFTASTGATWLTTVPGASVPKPDALLEGCMALTKTTQMMDVISTSSDERVVLFKRKTSDEPYGVISVVFADGIPKASFCHYPVQKLDEKDLKDHIYKWASMDTFDGKAVKKMRLQFNGLLVKVFADASGDLRFATKTKAQLCKEHETILLDTLVENLSELSGITDRSDALLRVKAALMTCTKKGITLTFRLVHPAVCYVKGPVDMSKQGPKAILVQWGDKHIDTQEDLPLRGFFMTAGTVMDACDLDTFGAVMIEFNNAETGVEHYAKLVSKEFHEKLQLVEGINGNFVAHLTRVGCTASKVSAIRQALDAVHWPAFDEAVKVVLERSATDPAIVARFLERNYKALLDEKSSLVSALFKMDAKKASKLVGAAKMFNPKRGPCATFIKGMKADDVARHAQLLTTIVDGKLEHPKPEVSAAARLIKTCL